MTRAVVLVLDSFGLGATPDAAQFGDVGANTFGHIVACRAAQGQPLHLPHLMALGLGHAAQAASGEWPAGLAPQPPTSRVAHSAAREASRGKDTPSGHWEMMGCSVPFDWGYFPTEAALASQSVGALAGGRTGVFPADLMHAWYRACGLEGSLCNGHASGTEVIDRLGDEHLRTGWPICYTSADSVFQVAAHETAFGLERLYAICEAAKPIFDKAHIARVIARPFVGGAGQPYRRTGHRRDLTTPPPGETLLDRLLAHGRQVHAVGKIPDIFAHRGISHAHKGDGNAALCQATLQALGQCADGGLVFANLVDFDMLYGHRRDVAGYAQALEAFDAWLPRLQAALQPGDLLLLTADHGCDPTWPGSDHTREHVPLLFSGPACPALGGLPISPSFADMGQTLAQHLGVGRLAHGEPCWA